MDKLALVARVLLTIAAPAAAPSDLVERLDAAEARLVVRLAVAFVIGLATVVLLLLIVALAVADLRLVPRTVALGRPWTSNGRVALQEPQGWLQVVDAAAERTSPPATPRAGTRRTAGAWPTVATCATRGA